MNTRVLNDRTDLVAPLTSFIAGGRLGASQHGAPRLVFQLGGAALVLSMGTACGHHETLPVVAPTSVIIDIPPPPPAHAVPPPVVVGLNISEEVQRQCKLKRLESMTEAPKFAFDSSLIPADEIATLQQVATCVTSGPLKGKTVTLVGRADPRGPNRYNMALGEKRATAVQDVLVKFGVGSPNVTTSSRGKKDATGTDDDGWQLDRRVDIGVTM